MNGFLEIGTAIKSVLETIPGLTVFGFEKAKMESFPCASITAASFSPGGENPYSNNSVMREFVFAIRLYHIVREEEAENTTRKFVDEIVNKFDNPDVLAGTALFTRPTNVNFGYINTGEQGGLRTAEISILCKVEKIY